MSIVWHTGLLSSLAEKKMFVYHGRRSNGVVEHFFLYYFCSARWLDKEKRPLNQQDDAFSHTSIIWHDGLLFSLAERRMFADGVFTQLLFIFSKTHCKTLYSTKAIPVLIHNWASFPFGREKDACWE